MKKFEFFVLFFIILVATSYLLADDADSPFSTRVEMNYRGNIYKFHESPTDTGTFEVVIGCRLDSGQVDIAFAVDTSGSMGGEIADIKSSMDNLATRLHELNYQYRFGFATVCDNARIMDFDPTIPGYQMTGNFRQFRTRIMPIGATGGSGCGPEYIYPALWDVMTQYTWRAEALKIVFICTDEGSCSEDVNPCPVCSVYARDTHDYPEYRSPYFKALKEGFIIYSVCSTPLVAGDVAFWDTLYRKIARYSGGTWFNTTTPWTTVFRHVLANIDTCLAINICVTNNTIDDFDSGWIQIELGDSMSLTAGSIRQVYYPWVAGETHCFGWRVGAEIKDDGRETCFNAFLTATNVFGTYTDTVRGCIFRPDCECPGPVVDNMCPPDTGFGFTLYSACEFQPIILHMEDDDTTIDTLSIILNVDDINYTFPDHMEFDPASGLLTFTPDTEWTHMFPVMYSLVNATDANGCYSQSIVMGKFNLDFESPILYENPTMIPEPILPYEFTDSFVNVRFLTSDLPSGVNPTSIVLMINGDTLDMGSPNIIMSPHQPIWLLIHGTKRQLGVADLDTMMICLYLADKVNAMQGGCDLCGPNDTTICYEFYFNDPMNVIIDNPPDSGVSACNPLKVGLKIIDPNRDIPDETTFKVEVIINETDTHYFIDDDGVFTRMGSNLVMFEAPAGFVVSGDEVKFKFIEGKDVQGRPIYPPFPKAVFTMDFDPPVMISHYPPEDTLLMDFPYEPYFSLFDSIAGLDEGYISVIVNGAFAFPWTGSYDTMDVYNVTNYLDPAICYGLGETCRVNICVDAADNPDDCGPNMMHECFTYYWLHGRPWIRAITPLANSYFACLDSGILIEIRGGAGLVDSTSIWMSIHKPDSSIDIYNIFDDRLQYITDMGPESLLYFDAPPLYFTEGEVYMICIDKLYDFAGDSMRIQPTCWTFTPDFTPPMVTNFLPRNDSLMPTPTPEISFRVDDAIAGIDDAELYVRIFDWTGLYTYDDTFYTTNPLVTWDGTNYKLDFHGSSYVFENGDTIQVCVYAPDNSIHCGPNATEFCSTFVMRLTGPTANVVGPLDGYITACDDQKIKITIEDDDGTVDFSTAEIDVNGILYPASAGSPVSIVGDTLIFTPDSITGMWVDAQLVTVSLAAADDEWCNALATPITWSFRVDLKAPVYTDLFPVCDDTSFTRSPRITFRATDNLAGIDLEESYIELDGSKYAFSAPEFDMDGDSVTFHCLRAGLVWTEGEIMHMCLVLKDKVDYCGPNVDSSCCQILVIPRGPAPSALVPADAAYSSCDPEAIDFTLYDEDGVDIGSLVFRVTRGVTTVRYDVISPEITIDSSMADETFSISFSPLIPFGNGESLYVCIDTCFDIWTNELAPPRPRCWFFKIDLLPPQIISRDPDIDEVVLTRTPIITVNMVDNGSGIDLSTVEIDVNGITYTPTVSGDDFIWDPEDYDVKFTGCDTIPVCIRASDLAEYCGVNSMERCWEFSIECGGPIASVVRPLDGYYTSCDPESIVIHIVDHNGLDNPTLALTVRGTAIPWGSSGLRWDALSENLIYIPPAGFSIAEDVNVKLTTLFDMLGNPLDGSLDWTFYIDREKPYPSAPSPVGTIAEIAPIITINIKDIMSKINEDSLELVVDGIPYRLTHPALTYDAISYILRFDPTLAPDFWIGGDTVTVCLNAFDNAHDLCDPNDTLYCWDFDIETGAPTVEFDHPGNGKFLACNPDSIFITLTDPNGVVTDSIEVVVKVNLTVSDRIPFDAPLPSTISGLIETPTSASFYYKPLAPWANGDVVTISVVTGDDSLFNALDSIGQQFTIDYEPPIIVDHTPANLDTILPTSPVIDVEVDDLLAGVNPNTMRFVLGAHSFTWPNAALSWDGIAGIASLDLGVAGITFPGDTTIQVTFWIGDDVDTINCGPNMIDATWEFIIMPLGPMAELIYPEDGIFDGCYSDSVIFWLVDRQSNEIDLSTVYIRYESNIHDLQVIGIGAGSGLYFSTVNDTFLIFHPTSPEFADAEQVTICLTDASDALGNALFYEVCVTFTIDVSPFTAMDFTPYDREVIRELQPIISVHVIDSVTGINPSTLELKVNNTVYPFSSGLFDYTADVVTFDPAALGTTWTGGDSVFVTISGDDQPTEGYCQPHDTIYEWYFWVSDEPPIVERLFPIMDTTSCNEQIRVALTDQDGVNHASVQIRVNGVVYDLSSGNLAYDDSTLIFIPTTDFEDGELVNICVVMAIDNLNNRIHNEYCWDYLVDITPPWSDLIRPEFEIVYLRDQIIILDIGDVVAGVDVPNIYININGIDYNPSDYTWDRSSSINGGRLTFNPLANGVEWAPNDSVYIKIIAYDFATDLDDECVDYVLDTSISFFVEQIFGCEVTPNPFTPNYDGINDIAIFEYPKMYDRAIGASDVYIYDMHGVEVRSFVIEKLTDSREYKDRAWDGFDDDGNPLPPGVYMWIVIMQKTEEVLCSGTITLAR